MLIRFLERGKRCFAPSPFKEAASKEKVGADRKGL